VSTERKVLCTLIQSQIKLETFLEKNQNLVIHTNDIKAK